MAAARESSPPPGPNLLEYQRSIEFFARSEQELNDSGFICSLCLNVMRDAVSFVGNEDPSRGFPDPW